MSELREAVAELRLTCHPTPEVTQLEGSPDRRGRTREAFRVYREGRRRMLGRREPPVFLGWRIMPWLFVPVDDPHGWLEDAVEQMISAGGSRVWGLDQGTEFGWRPIGAEASMNEAIRRILRLVVYVHSKRCDERGAEAR